MNADTFVQVDKELMIGFAVVVLGFLALDLGVLNRRAHVVKFREALGWTAFWVSLACAFCAAVYFRLGQDAAVTFFTAYVIEQSLSVDNLFVFLLIFSAFRVPAELQHRVLFWGILGALGMRAICIFAGVAALQKFDWLMYVFGAILIWGGIKTALEKDEPSDPKDGVLSRLVRKVIPVTEHFEGQKFFTRLPDRRLAATPLFLALVTVEVSDVIFAVDSIPAVLAISLDPFIVYTSNVFAILGLRSIYFALAHMMGLFHFLKYGLSVILIFVGIKISASHHYKLPVEIALGVIVAVLALSVLASVGFKPKTDAV